MREYGSNKKQKLIFNLGPVLNQNGQHSRSQTQQVVTLSGDKTPPSSRLQQKPNPINSQNSTNQANANNQNHTVSLSKSLNKNYHSKAQQQSTLNANLNNSQAKAAYSNSKQQLVMDKFNEPIPLMQPAQAKANGVFQKLFAQSDDQLLMQSNLNQVQYALTTANNNNKSAEQLVYKSPPKTNSSSKKDYFESKSYTNNNSYHISQLLPSIGTPESGKKILRDEKSSFKIQVKSTDKKIGSNSKHNQVSYVVPYSNSSQSYSTEDAIQIKQQIKQIKDAKDLKQPLEEHQYIAQLIENNKNEKVVERAREELLALNQLHAKSVKKAKKKGIQQANQDLNSKIKKAQVSYKDINIDNVDQSVASSSINQYFGLQSSQNRNNQKNQKTNLQNQKVSQTDTKQTKQRSTSLPVLATSEAQVRSVTINNVSVPFSAYANFIQQDGVISQQIYKNSQSINLSKEKPQLKKYFSNLTTTQAYPIPISNLNNNLIPSGQFNNQIQKSNISVATPEQARQVQLLQQSQSPKKETAQQIALQQYKNTFTSPNVRKNQQNHQEVINQHSQKVLPKIASSKSTPNLPHFAHVINQKTPINNYGNNQSPQKIYDNQVDPFSNYTGQKNLEQFSPSDRNQNLISRNQDLNQNLNRNSKDNRLSTIDSQQESNKNDPYVYIQEKINSLQSISEMSRTPSIQDLINKQLQQLKNQSSSVSKQIGSNNTTITHDEKEQDNYNSSKKSKKSHMPISTDSKISKARKEAKEEVYNDLMNKFIEFQKQQKKSTLKQQVPIVPSQQDVENPNYQQMQPLPADLMSFVNSNEPLELYKSLQSKELHKNKVFQEPSASFNEQNLKIKIQEKPAANQNLPAKTANQKTLADVQDLRKDGIKSSSTPYFQISQDQHTINIILGSQTPPVEINRNFKPQTPQQYIQQVGEYNKSNSKDEQSSLKSKQQKDSINSNSIGQNPPNKPIIINAPVLNQYFNQNNGPPPLIAQQTFTTTATQDVTLEKSSQEERNGQEVKKPFLKKRDNRNQALAKASQQSQLKIEMTQKTLDKLTKQFMQEQRSLEDLTLQFGSVDLKKPVTPDVQLPQNSRNESQLVTNQTEPDKRHLWLTFQFVGVLGFWTQNKFFLRDGTLQSLQLLNTKFKIAIIVENQSPQRIQQIYKLLGGHEVIDALFSIQRTENCLENQVQVFSTNLLNFQKTILISRAVDQFQQTKEHENKLQGVYENECALMPQLLPVSLDKQFQMVALCVPCLDYDQTSAISFQHITQKIMQIFQIDDQTQVLPEHDDMLEAFRIARQTKGLNLFFDRQRELWYTLSQKRYEQSLLRLKSKIQKAQFLIKRNLNQITTPNQLRPAGGGSFGSASRMVNSQQSLNPVLVAASLNRVDDKQFDWYRYEQVRKQFTFQSIQTFLKQYCQEILKDLMNPTISNKQQSSNQVQNIGGVSTNSRVQRQTVNQTLKMNSLSSNSNNLQGVVVPNIQQVVNLVYLFENQLNLLLEAPWLKNEVASNSSEDEDANEDAEQDIKNTKKNEKLYFCPYNFIGLNLQADQGQLVPLQEYDMQTFVEWKRPSEGFLKLITVNNSSMWLVDACSCGPLPAETPQIEEQEVETTKQQREN